MPYFLPVLFIEKIGYNVPIMSQTLYRKYRPQVFIDVVEQTHIVKILSQQLIDNSFSHAYLFSGPRGTGKTTLARIVAKRLNCLDPQKAEPCNLCASCVAINENRSLDFIEIDAASNRGINEIRELKENVKTGTSGSQYKVFVIDEVHMLTTEAFNALLKTLEEPPEHAIFILATTELHKLPETIVSRCQQFRFGKVTLAGVMGLLKKICDQEKIVIDEKVLRLVARRSGGYVRDALSLLGQLVVLAGEKINEENASLILPKSSWQHVSAYVTALLKQDGVTAMAEINESVNQGLDLDIFVFDALELVRLLTIGTITDNWEDLSWVLEVDQVNEYKKLLTIKNLDNLTLLTDVLIEAHGRSGSLGIPELPLQAATAKYLSRKQVKSSDKIDPPNALTTDASVTKPNSTASSVIKSTIKAVSNIAKKSQPETEAVELNNNILDVPNVTLEEIANSWLLIINDVRHKNQTLAGFLQTARPEKFENGILTISFSYGFHWDKLHEIKNQTMMLEALTSRWPGMWRLLGVVSKEKHESLSLPTVSQEGEVINDSISAMEVFAGQMAS